MKTSIFYGKSCILLTNDVHQYQYDEKSYFLDSYDKQGYFSAVSKLKEGLLEKVIIASDNLEELLQKIKSQYEVIEAAGGIITNHNDDTLMIYRRGKWDLPKGKIEPNETTELAAEREIEEETGVTNLKIHQKLPNTYHIYQENGKDIFKITHWFHFSIDENPILIPQLEEEITEIKWFSKEELPVALNNTYESVKDLMINSCF